MISNPDPNLIPRSSSAYPQQPRLVLQDDPHGLTTPETPPQDYLNQGESGPPRFDTSVQLNIEYLKTFKGFLRLLSLLMNLLSFICIVRRSSVGDLYDYRLGYEGVPDFILDFYSDYNS